MPTRVLPCRITRGPSMHPGPQEVPVPVFDSAELGPLELLVLQPTPFCNIDCSYCYLPGRQSIRRMSAETLEHTFRWVFSSGLARQEFTLLWHAGEPLVLPVSF